MFEDLADALQTVSELCLSPAVAGDQADMAAGVLTDAHKYTRTLIREHYPILMQADLQFINSHVPEKSMPDLISEIQTHMQLISYPVEMAANVNQVLVSIHGVEQAETYIDMPDLLLRVWNLATMASTQLDDHGLRAQVLACLEGNISDQGGCRAGIVARLYPAYAKLLAYQLQYYVTLDFSLAPGF